MNKLSILIVSLTWILGSCVKSTPVATTGIIGIAACNWIDSDKEGESVDVIFVKSDGGRFHKVMKEGEQFGPITFSSTFGLGINVGGISPALIVVAEFKYRQHDEKILRVPIVPETDIRFLKGGAWLAVSDRWRG